MNVPSTEERSGWSRQHLQGGQLSADRGCLPKRLVIQPFIHCWLLLGALHPGELPWYLALVPVGVGHAQGATLLTPAYGAAADAP
eukprot:CAMPEP_0185202786 /NCGR_PEP_ID=MMETSP1140-20130426/51704_1 /TAXON_ID=298111 /ORGANISM="Pavlova sp., Strain CCMP459" /LENGTH=84 /DNA_ID=CAMNT_0027770251 /DNA_START=30 /DNA_END=281 /DNA_ORIENTATION=+